MTGETSGAREGPAGEGVAVSVIVAAWHARAFIDASIDSALAEDAPTLPLEVVVCDDASSDGTLEHIAARAAADPRIVALRAEVNAGPSAARNRAIAAARGTWLAVLDSDDRFAPGRLSRLLQRAEATGADIVLDNLQEVTPEGMAAAPGPFLPLTEPETWTLARWAEDNRVRRVRCTGFLKPLFRRAFLDAHAIRYREEMRNSEDYAIIADALAAGARLVYEPVPGYLYTRREGSLSHRYEPGALSHIIAYAEALRARMDGQVGPDALRALTRHLEALRDAEALDATVDALRRRAPVAALAAIAKRPRMLPLLGTWVAEAVGKRLPRG